MPTYCSASFFLPNQQLQNTIKQHIKHYNKKREKGLRNPTKSSNLVRFF
jgi:hypothetical protein